MLLTLIKLELNRNIIGNLDGDEAWFYLNDETVSLTTFSGYVNKYDEMIM